MPGPGFHRLVAKHLPATWPHEQEESVLTEITGSHLCLESLQLFSGLESLYGVASAGRKETETDRGAKVFHFHELHLSCSLDLFCLSSVKL